MSNTNSNSINTYDAVARIMNKRVSIPQSAIGKSFTVIIQRDAVIQPVMKGKGDAATPVESVNEPGRPLFKAIFNAKAYSELAYNSKYTKDMLYEAIRAEKIGDVEAAGQLYNDYLNALQFSFNVLLTGDKARELVARMNAGTEVTGIVEEVTTENGSFITFEQGSVHIETPLRGAKNKFSADAALAGYDLSFATPEEGVAAPAATETVSTEQHEEALMP